MAVASYFRCKSSPGVGRGFAILRSRLEQFKFLKTTHDPSINRTVNKLRFLTAGYIKRYATNRWPGCDEQPAITAENAVSTAA
jgi:hypothetical protein